MSIDILENEIITLKAKLNDSLKLNNEMLTRLGDLENKCAINFRYMKQQFDEIKGNKVVVKGIQGVASGPVTVTSGYATVDMPNETSEK